MLKILVNIFLLAAVAHATMAKRNVTLGVLTSWKGGVYDNHALLLGVLPAIDLVNQSPELLPNHTLNFAWADTQCATRYSAEAATALFDNYPVDALIGCVCSGDALLIAPLATYHRVPFISSFAIHPWLSNKATYPAFARVVGTTTTYANTAIRFMQHMRFEFAGVVYPASSSFSQGWAESVRTALIDANITKQCEIAYSSVDPSIATLLKDSGVRVVLYLSYDCAAMRQTLLMAFDNHILAGWTWILRRLDSITCLIQGDNGDGRDDDVLAAYNGTFGLFIFFEVAEEDYSALDRRADEFTPFVQPLSGTAAPFDAESIHHDPYELNYTASDFIVDTSANIAAVLTFDAIHFYAHALHSWLSHGGAVRDLGIVNELISTTMSGGMTGNISLDASGDRQDGTVLYNAVVHDKTSDPHVLIGGYDVATDELTIFSGAEASFVFGGGHTKVPADRALWCNPGQYVSNGSLALCTTGTFASSSEWNREACEVVPAGFYQNKEGASDYVQCVEELGQTSAAGSEFCDLCMIGFYRYNDQCESCAPGYFFDADSVTCISCEKGSYQPDSNSLAAQCTLCPVSTYASSTGMAECLECGDWIRQADGSERRMGSFSTTSGAEACTSCPNDGADCYDGQDVIVRKNWWRNSRETLLIRQCLNDYCGGGALSNLDHQCLQNHTGALCMLCADPFALDLVDGSCVLCEKGDKQKEQAWIGIWMSIFFVTGGMAFVAVRKCACLAHATL
jgi:ABC-type branched-subunit amino acid transport system substrate-binding protein